MNIAIFNFTQEQLQVMSFFDLERYLKWAITEYNKTFNRPMKINVVIYDDKDSGPVMTMSDEFLNDAKKLTRNHMKLAIADMKSEYKKRFKENEGYPTEYSDAKFNMDMLFKGLEEQNRKTFGKGCD